MVIVIEPGFLYGADHRGHPLHAARFGSVHANACCSLRSGRPFGLVDCQKLPCVHIGIEMCRLRAPAAVFRTAAARRTDSAEAPYRRGLMMDKSEIDWTAVMGSPWGRAAADWCDVLSVTRQLAPVAPSRLQIAPDTPHVVFSGRAWRFHRPPSIDNEGGAFRAWEQNQIGEPLRVDEALARLRWEDHVAADAARTAPTVTPGASSRRTRPSGLGSITAISATMRSTTGAHEAADH